MATLTVKNVGPIREAEITIKKHTVFIGPQGTGKSTLAKLIAIGGDSDIFLGAEIDQEVFKKYTISSYTTNDSNFNFATDAYRIVYENSRLELIYKKERDTQFRSQGNLINISEESLEYVNQYLRKNFTQPGSTDFEIGLESYMAILAKFEVTKKMPFVLSSYIPAERTLLAILNESIWSLVNSDIDFPKSITSFARNFTQARSQMKLLNIPFLAVDYHYEQGIDVLIDKGNSINLSQSASGYQSIIPLLLVIEHQRQASQRRFIIEEPELNLYPIAQKELIYTLVGGLQLDVDYKEAEWIITTHSPYVLSSFNTMMLAYKVAQRSDELRAEVEKIIPARCWINPDDFAAYYVDNGTVRSIISEKTGLIADNELDDVSEDLAGEQDQLFELSRSVPRA